MNDPIERNVRDALSNRAAQLDSDAVDRLRAVDYRPRRSRVGKLSAIGGLGGAGIAGAIVATISLTSAAPAFAGWSPKPATATPHDLALAAQSCGQGLGSPVLSESRGPYTATVYSSGADSAVCFSGGDLSMYTTTSGTPYGNDADPAAGQIQFSGGETSDSAGDSLTMADGQAGAGVSAVTVELSDGSSVQATVSNGWYMAWWPGTATATSAQVSTASGTQSEAYQAPPALPQCSSTTTAPECISGVALPNGWSSAGGPGTSVTRTTGAPAAGSTGDTGNTGG